MLIEMRFQLFDKILEFKKGKSIVGVKNVTLESGSLISLNGALFYPASLSIEALAQLGGWFINASRDFSLLLVLGMIVAGEIRQDIMIGDSLTLKVNLLELMPETSVVNGEVWKKGACALKVDRIVYGMFKMEDKRFIKEQEKMFRSFFGSKES